MEKRKKLLLAAAIVLLAIAAAGFWAYRRANEVCQRRIVLDDASSAIRLETVSRNGRIRELRRENWTKNDRIQRRKIASEMERQSGYVNEWIIRVDGSAGFSHVYACFVDPIAPTCCIFEIAIGDGRVVRIPCAVAWVPDEGRGCLIVGIDVHNRKLLSHFLRTDLMPLRGMGSTKVAAYLAGNGIKAKIAPVLPVAIPIDGMTSEHLRQACAFKEERYEFLYWGLMFSRYTTMADVAAAHSKLSALGMKYRQIRLLELRNSFVESPEDRE